MAVELSTTQKGIYFDCQVEDPIAYNIAATIELSHVDGQLLEQAFKLLIAEQEMLRTSFGMKNDLPVMLIAETSPFHLQQQDISNQPNQKEMIRSNYEEEILIPFDLAVAPLLRARLLRTSNNTHVLILCVHHLVADGLSVNILLEKVLKFHNVLLNNEEIALHTDSGFSSFARLENDGLLKNKYKKQQEYWINKIDGAKPLELTPDLTATKGGVGREARFSIPNEVVAQLTDLAMQQEVTLYMLFMASFGILLSNCVQSDDIVFSSPFTYRPDFDWQETIGCFINMLCLRLKVEQSKNFKEVLQEITQEIIGAYKHIQYPNNLLLRSSSQTADIASFFDVTFVYDTYAELRDGDVTARVLHQDLVPFPGSLMVVLNKVENEHLIKIQYKPELFKEDTIQLLGSKFLELLDLVANNSEILVKDVNLFSPDQCLAKKSREKKVINQVDRPFTSNSSEIENTITSIWQEVLGVEQIKLDDNFFDVGGHSLALIQVNNKLKAVNLNISIKEHFQLPTARSLAQYFTKDQLVTIETQSSTQETKQQPNLHADNQDIAIIGLSVNVPGAQNLAAFWDILKNEKETILFYQDEELLALGISPEIINSPNYVKAVGRVEGTEHFDPLFFDYPPAEINLMSPQLRLLYPGLWQAFEDAGYYPNADDSRIGLYISGSDDFEWYKEKITNENNYSLKYQSYTLSTNHFLATRLAYKLDLKGPVFTVISGCSSTLVTVHLACQALKLGECDLAVAGGITVELPNQGGYFYEPGMMFSPDGHCRPFDAKAAGTFFSNGMGLVVLKRLTQALEDGDHIYAVIKGSAINNDGSDKLGYTAPSVKGQADAIRSAYRVAGIDPKTINYVEAHGTGTELGDPIEVESLTQVFATDKKQYCTLSSVKGNIGHPDTAAGVVGLTKVALAFEHKFIPGTVNYETPNHRIDFENSPFIVKPHGDDWILKNDLQIRRAGINSFGVGGTNAHMVLEEPPAQKSSSAELSSNILVFSGQSESALKATAYEVLSYLHHNKELNLSDAAWTLQIGRKPFAFRKAVVLTRGFVNESEAVIEQMLSSSMNQHSQLTGKPVYLLFSGQGSQYQGMARDLYHSQESQGVAAIFRKHCDQVLSLLSADEHALFTGIIFGESDSERINQTEYAQFALFCISYALAKTIMDLGVKPSGLVGHSIGEITAATVAGVFELKDAVEIVRLRGQLMQQQRPGTMLAVMADSEQVQAALTADVWLALENTTNACVVGGEENAIIEFEKKCEQLQWATARLKTSHAFHTPMMSAAAATFKERLASYEIKSPCIPIVSNVNGEWLTSDAVMNAEYWAQHILQPVKFSQCLQQILTLEESLLLEVGPGQVLTSLVKQHSSKKSGHEAINLIHHPKQIADDLVYLNQKIGHLWCLGIPIDWYALKGEAHRRRLSLPTYVFDKHYYPIKLNSGHAEKALDNCTAVMQPIPHTIERLADNANQLETSIILSFKAVLGFAEIHPNQDFFALGGDSLKAINLASTIHNDLGLKIDIKDIFKYPTPHSLAEYLATNANLVNKQQDIIKPATAMPDYPLSSAQRRMFTLYLLDKESLAYNLPSATMIAGELDYERFTLAFNKLIRRHEPLRTTIAIRAGLPVQIIHDNCEQTVAIIESYTAKAEEIDELIHDFIKPFDLQEGPLFRAQLVKIAPDRHLFLFDIHHIIADGTSMEIVARDFNELYNNNLSELTLQFKDYAVWQSDYLHSKTMAMQKEFWISELEGDLPVCNFPTDYERPSIRVSQGDRYYFTIDPELSKAISQFSQESGTTLFMTLLSAWSVLVARYSGQEDLIIGVPVAGRTRQEVAETVGMFVNLLPIRLKPGKDIEFDSYLTTVKETVVNAFNNQDYQFDDLLQQLNLRRDLSRNALVDICFDLQNMQMHDLAIENLTFSPYQFSPRTVAYDLLLTCQENKQEGTIQAFIDYSTSLFSPGTIERCAANFTKLLEEIVANKKIALSEIDIVSLEEQKMIARLNDTFLDQDPKIRVHELFEENVKRCPEKIALVVSTGESFTYQQLNQKANSLAYHLLELSEDRFVGIMTERNEFLIIAMLAVLKAGKAFVLIDPQLPSDRIEHMINACQLQVLLHSSKQRFEHNSTGINLALDKFDFHSVKRLAVAGLQTNLAYVMFTSGSTGVPKGVMVEHSSLVNFIADSVQRKLFMTSTDRIISLTTISFDIFLFESLVPLCTGHSIYLANELEQLDPFLANNKIIAHDVTHILSTVSRVKLFVENNAFKKALHQLKCILSGGENFPQQLLATLQQQSHARIFNLYGPTETTVWSTAKELTRASYVTIGGPIANTQLYIVNEALKMQPLGVFGELCIAGKGVARGYLNTTNYSNFTQLPNSISIYRTGDRARWLLNGEIELQGRLDSQVKIRGYRIELAELEKIVLTHPDIREAVSLPFDDKSNNKQLALFFSTKTTENRSVNANNWLQLWLQEKVPAYFMPAYFKHLDGFPTLPNGKMDKAALVVATVESKAEIDWSLTQLEATVLSLWQEVLSADAISVHDNFFDLGGNSLGLIQISNKLSAILGLHIPLVDLFKYPTIATLAASLSQDSSRACPESNEPINSHTTDIAVIGLAGKFPGADSVEEFWQNIISGKESITHFNEEELLAAGIDEQMLANQSYVPAKGYLENAEYFDAHFFNYSDNEASLMDPQARLLHQCAWQVLENGGYDPYSYKEKIGLFAGSGSNVLWISNLIKDDHQDLLNAFEVITLNEKDFLTTRLSYKLNLTGPSINVQTACSTSLVAIHQAVQSLHNGECAMAIAGGVAISYPRKEGYIWHEGMIFSKDGHCKPFAEDSSGIVPGNGCGLVLLKPLSAAIKDGDYIYAVIKGSAINNDGIAKVGYTAPSISGQTDVITKALATSQIQPEDISYLEAHGTGTAIGDPIEIEALKAAWGTDQQRYCAIGSVKANIGHLDAAAGVASFIKTVLVLGNRTIPPQINVTATNPRIDFKNSPFYINLQSGPFPEEKILRAAVSSFGIGGTNAHVILEQSPIASRSKKDDNIHILLCSGKTQDALKRNGQKLLEHLRSTHDLNMSDIAWTLQVGRKPFEFRKVLMIKGGLDNVPDTVIQNFLDDPGHSSAENRLPLLFSIPDSTSFSAEQLIALYKNAEKSEVTKLFKRHCDEVLKLFSLGKQRDIANHFDACTQQTDGFWMPQSNEGMTWEILSFVSSYALSRTLLDLEIMPDALYGVGIGELCALVIADAMSLKDAVSLLEKCNEQQTQWSQQIAFHILKSPKIPVIKNTDKLSAFQHLDLSDRFKHDHTNTLDNSVYWLNSMIANLWCRGTSVNWKALNSDFSSRRVPLPGYEFERKAFISDIKTAGSDLNLSKIEVNATLQPEKQLLKIWTDIFKRDSFAQDDNFFELGGDSLKAILLTSRLQKSLGIDIAPSEIFKFPTFGEMQTLLETSNEKSSVESLVLALPKEHYTASSAQKRLYAIHQLLGEAVPYNLASAYLLKGYVDKDKLRSVFRQLTERHESLRTTFEIQSGEVVQVIHDCSSDILEYEVSSNALSEQITAFIRPFDLATGPLFRAKLITINELEHILVVDAHHIIADQTSLVILVQEIAELYTGKQLEPLAMQYKNFALWQQRNFDKSDYQQQLAYWISEFKGELPTLNLPIDYSRPAIRQFVGQRQSFQIERELSDKLNALARKHAITPYMLFMAAFKLTLWKYSSQQDLVVGTATTGRNQAQLQRIVGMFANTLAIRTKIDPNMNVAEYLAYIKSKILLALENQDCQLEQLIDVLKLDKDLSRNPLFDVVFNYIDLGDHELKLDGISLEPWSNLPVFAKFDLTLTIEKASDCYLGDIEFNTSLFKSETIQLFIDRLQRVINFIVGQSNASLTELNLLNETEFQYQVYELNKTETPFPENATIIELFHEQVEQHPDNAAIEWQGIKLSYRDLDQQAEAIAQLLMDQGVTYGHRVCLLLKRGPLQIASILATLKCGAAYVPIDPKYPLDRINFMLQDSEAKLLISDDFKHDFSQRIQTLYLDKENLDCSSLQNRRVCLDKITAEDLAYIIYTSGSTGTPKGVLSSHRNVIRTVKNTNYVTIDKSDRLLQISNYAFDGSIFDIFGALLNGACLVLLPAETIIEISELVQSIRDQAITIFFITTALFNKVVEWDVNCLKSMRTILIGGEVASLIHMRLALEAIGPGKLVNVYGPTESTFIASYFEMNDVSACTTTLPIGRPLANTQLYVLDDNLSPVPVGLTGELYIGGSGVANGYLNRHQLTREKFLTNPFAEGLLYKTGDLVKQLADGTIIFLNRKDSQVKIRGFRVELGEVETALCGIKGIASAVVIVVKDRDQRDCLVAYYTSDLGADEQLGAEQVREQLAIKLPHYLIPTHLIQLEALPLNPNGKVDRKALAQKVSSASSRSPEISRNREDMILATMRSVLVQPQLNYQDDFFRFGGHSINAITLVHELAQQGINIKVTDVFQYPTAQRLAGLSRTNHLLSSETKVEEGIDVNPEGDAISTLLAYLKSMSLSMSNIIGASSVKAKFKFSAVQQLHSRFSNRYSGFTNIINTVLTEEEIRSTLVAVITENQLLHSVCNFEEVSWKEHDISAVINIVAKAIPYLDISSYDSNTRHAIINEMSKWIVSSPYTQESLRWRCCCLRINDRDHQLIWGFDHIAFDGMSAQVLRSQLEAKINQLQLGKPYASSNLPNYENYVETLQRGPQGITENTIVQWFALSNWATLNASLITKINKRAASTAGDLKIEIPLSEYSIKEPLTFILPFLFELLSDYFSMDELPIGLINYGRSYEDNDYYHCVGEFLDIIPILINKGNQHTVIELLQRCRQHNINFTSLLSEPTLVARFPNISELLTPAYKKSKSTLDMILINIQGYIADGDKRFFQQAMASISNDRLAVMPITISYDDEKLMVSLPIQKNKVNAVEKRISALLAVYQRSSVNLSSNEVDYV